MARKSRVTAQIVEPEQEDISLVGLYSRISVEDGDDEDSNSLGNQKKIGIHYLTEHPGMKLVDTYADNGYTGMNYDRPDFRRMLDDLRKGRINCIVVKDISRLGRHFLQTSELVERIFPEMGVRLICINDGFDSDEAMADASALTLPLKMVMNDYYVKDISRKIRSGIAAKMNAGDYLPSSGSIPYGYLRNPAAVTYDIDPETEPVIKRIFELRASGMSLNGIAAVLNREGIPSPGKLRYSRGVTMSKRNENASWIRGTIRKILSDEVYIGNRVHGRLQSDKYGCEKTKRREEQWRVVGNAHPSIISQELFEKVQQIAASEKERRGGFQKRETVDTCCRGIFRDKIFCAECGGSMSAGKGLPRLGSDNTPWIFYDCNNYKYSSRLRCSSHYIRQEKIMSTIEDLLNQQAQMAVDVDRMYRTVQGSKEAKVFLEGANARYASAVRRRRRMEARLEELWDELALRKIGRHKFEYERELCTQQINQLLDEEAQALADRNALDAAIASSRQWVEALRKYRRFPQITRELVELLIDRIEITQTKDIKVTLRYADPYREVYHLISRMEDTRDAV